ncbi:hypothetical protein CSA56_15535 [candidate division KSB3 bacterium]|uniref:Glycosyltransferase family 1 protein n=1 Tax=candidate division KSB3 bacterium TaxID=2044937 RepID=A0A2G6KC84_9BACT|nr:MAG: hypothetical protein CSA56_15535 [candidate division KSB3 bacterium]
MTVVLFANTAWYLYNYRKNLIAALVRSGHEVHAIAPFDPYVEKLTALGITWHGTSLHQTSINPFSELQVLWELRSLFHTIRPDVILTFTIKCNLYTGFLQKWYGFAHIANVSGIGELFNREHVLKRLGCVFYQHSLCSAKKVFFQNNEDLHTFLTHNILPERICERLPGSGVDLKVFTPNGHQKKAKTTRIFLMAGRIIAPKGYELFLQAAQSLRNVSTRNVEFWILGIPDTSRKESGKLLEKIRSFHASNIVKLLSPTNCVASVIQQADVMVLPSYYHEGVPRSLLEAMACGKPLITTDWKGCRDTVQHGVNGLLIEKRSLPALEHALRFFIQAPDSTLVQMGKASRRKAEHEFNEEYIIGKYLEEIHEVR